MSAADESPPWIELLVRMCAGESAEEPFVGILEVPRGEYGDEWPGTVRVFKDRERYRVEALDGRLLTIRQAARTYVFHDDDAPARLDDDEDGEVHHGAHGSIIRRRHPTDWRGDDFTRPAGPPRAVTYLGRPAWEVELTPPPHKPSALVLTIDAENGMTLQQRSVEFGVISRWTELAEVESQPDELFTWDGDYAWAGSFGEDDVPAEVREAIEREQQEDAEQLAALRVPDLRVELTAHPDLHFVEDGSAHVSYHLGGLVIVERRPRSDDPWDHGSFPGESTEWSDGDTDWYVRVLSVGSDQLAAIRSQLAEPRPDRE